MSRIPWWQTRWFALAAILLSSVPLLLPSVPPLADLPGHIGRYHVAAALGGSADLQRHWIFEWGLVGNLGVDLLVQALSPILTAEQATKLVVMLIPPLWVSALILLARKAGGALSPAAGFAFPTVYGFAFQFGFVNFMLAGGLALHALLLWMALARLPLLRTFVFLPIVFVLWIAHSFGWGMFGLLAFVAEWVRLREAGERPASALVRAVGWCLPLAWPAALMLGATPPGDGALWDWKAKLSWFPSLLRERWKWYDVASAIAVFGVLWAAARDRRLRFDPLTGAAGLICLAAFVALPRLIVGGAYVDMRMLAPAAALLLIAIRVRPGHPRFEAGLAIAATGFFLLRTTTSTIAFLLFAQTQQQALEAVPHIPRGAAVLVLVNEPCSSQWRSDRLGHIAGIAVARRDIFENGQWALAGQQLLRPRHPQAEPYRDDPSHLVYPASCDYRTTHFDAAIRDFDRGTFRYVWTLDFPARPALASDVVLVWSNKVSALYAVR